MLCAREMFAEADIPLHIPAGILCKGQEPLDFVSCREGEGLRGSRRFSLQAALCVFRIACLCMLAGPAEVIGQELEPRAYSPSPIGANFLVIAFGDVSGSVPFDPTLPINNVYANFHSPVVGLGRTFGILGRQALVTAALPYAWGNVRGMVFEQQQSVYRSGLADLRVKFAFNLHGSPALTPEAFAQARSSSFLVGTSVEVSAPTGQYDKTRLITIGTNRWAVKPELGTSYLRKNWDFDLYGGVLLIPMKVIGDSDWVPVTGSEMKLIVFGAKRRWRSYRA